MQTDTLFLTVTTDLKHPGLATLCKSAMKWDIPLGVTTKTILGAGEEEKYNSFLDNKHLIIFRLLEYYCKQEGWKNFMYVDGWDTAFVRKPQEGELKPSRLCFGAEKNCYPYPDMAPRYPTTKVPFPFLNTGVIWGPIEEYLDLCPRTKGPDQALWTEVYLTKLGEVMLDRSADVALNLHSTEPQDLSRNSDHVRYVPTGTKPLVLHANGRWPMPLWV